MDPPASLVDVPLPGGASIRVCAAESTHHVLTGAAGGAGDHTGVLVWAGCRAMCAYLLAVGAHAGAGAPRRVLELGAGAGAAGVAAARAWPSARVTITDGAPAALALCRATVDANGVGDRVGVARLCWTDAAGVVWGGVTDGGEGRFDLVVGAEVVYPSSEFASMAAMFRVAQQAVAAPVVAGALAGGGGEAAPPPVVLACSYVERRPETTLAMLCAAWGAGLGFRVVPHARYWDAAEPPPLGAVVVEFTRRAPASGGSEGGGGEAHGGAAFDLAHAVDEVQRDGSKQGTWGHAVAAHFPSCVPAILAERALRAEIEEELAGWAPPLVEDDLGGSV